MRQGEEGKRDRSKQQLCEFCELNSHIKQKPKDRLQMRLEFEIECKVLAGKWQRQNAGWEDKRKMKSEFKNYTNELAE